MGAMFKSLRKGTYKQEVHAFFALTPSPSPTAWARGVGAQADLFEASASAPQLAGTSNAESKNLPMRSGIATGGFLI